MSSDEDDFESAFQSAKRNPRPKQTASKPGPSSTKAPTKAKSGQKKSDPPPRARAQTVEMEDEDDDVEALDDGDDDVRSTVQKPQAKKANTAKATTKGKGKTKAEPKQATSVSKPNGANGKGATTEDEVIDEDEDIQPIPRVVPPAPLAAHKPAVSNNSLVKENERLKKQLAAVTAERDTAMQTFMELARLRQSETEAPLEAMRLEREEISRTQNELLTLLKSDYTKSHLLPVKRGATAELITLDQAEEQRQDLLARSKAKDARILELQKQLSNSGTQDKKRVEDLEKQNRELERDLSEEIRNSKRLMDQLNKRPGGPGPLKPSTSRAADGQLDKWHLIRGFYQDMTGLLVQDVKEVIGSKNEKTETYSCLLTTSTTTEPHRELAFALSMYGGQSSGMSDEHVIYTPRDLDKAPDEEFLEAIDYLKDPFTFPRNQMQVFFNNLLEVLKGTQNAEEDEEDEEMEE